MADTFGLYEAWQHDRELAKRAVDEASELCFEYARAEAAYYAAKASAAMTMKAEGHPVTFIQTIVKGHPDVNAKLFDYTLAEGRYRAAHKAIDVYRDAMNQSYQEYKRSMLEMGE